MTSNDKRTYLINDLKQFGHYDENKDVFKFRYLYRSEVICAKAYEKLYLISHSTLCDIRRQVNEGVISVPKRRRSIEKGQSVAHLNFKAWFDNWKNGRGNPMLDSQDFHLAPGMKKGDIVKAYREQIGVNSTLSDDSSEGSTNCSNCGNSVSNLFTFLREDFDHVKKRRHVRFTKCSVCIKIEDKKKQAKNDSRRRGISFTNLNHANCSNGYTKFADHIDCIKRLLHDADK